MKLANYCILSTFLCYILITLVSSDSCPKQQEIRSDYVKQSFNITKFEGLYYETLYHDYTQPKFCKCQRANKLFLPKLNMIYDNFTLECFGSEFPNKLMFNLTEDRGVFIGWVNETILKAIRIPDTVVDVGINNDTGGYDWVIEFQCVEEFNVVLFIGINFYTRARFITNDTKNAMIEAAKRNGIGKYVAEGDLIVNDQTNCTYVQEERKRRNKLKI